MATKKKSKNVVYKRVMPKGARQVVTIPLALGAVASPVVGAGINTLVSVPVRYATALGALALFLGNRFAPKFVSVEMVKGGIASAIGAVSTGLATDVLGLSGPFSNNTLNARPLTRAQLEQRIANRRGIGYQATVDTGLGYQVTATRRVPSIAPTRNGPRRLF